MDPRATGDSPRQRPERAAHEPSQAARGAAVLFEADGMRVGRRRRRIRYADVTHLGISRRFLGIGTVNDTVLLPRRAFADDESMDRLGWGIVERIGRTRGGALQLARMAEIDHLVSRPRSHRAVMGFVLLCLVGLAVQLTHPFAVRAGSFVPVLAMGGEAWRVVTANFLHEMMLFPVHIGLNVLAVLALGTLVERVLGTPRTVVIMGAAALGCMLGCTLAGYPEVVGASGVAAGLAGAILAIELRAGSRLPVFWRIPRRLFVGAILIQATLDLLVPFIAAAAHAGGFAAGYLAAGLLVPAALAERPPGRALRVAATSVILLVALAGLAAAPLARLGGEALEQHGLRVLHTRSLTMLHDNDVAWLIVTQSEPSALGLQVAAALAERAVERSDRGNPDVLDTLAEVRFAMGDVVGALDAIDEAIGIDHAEPYYREQRKRFTGERRADDRPEAPALPWDLRGPRLDRGEGAPFSDEGVAI